MTLHDDVPEEIVIQFETAKNLYLYAWFVYRFYPVAQSQTYACLEFAMHRRFEQEMLNAGCEKKIKDHGFGLRKYLEFARDQEYLLNEDFEAWRQQVRVRAEERHFREDIAEMKRLGLSEMEIDESKIEITDADRDIDYLSDVFESMLYLRNHYAHGGNSLHSQVLGTFRVACEIINKVWSSPNRGAREGEDGDAK